MEKDKNLEELFGNFQPDLGSKDLFMSSLTRKLEAVEYVKRMQEAQIHRYKMAVLAAFVAGIVASLVLIAFVLFMPAATPLFTLGFHARPFIFIEENSHVIALIILSLVAASGIIGICTGFTDRPGYVKKPAVK